MPIYKRCNLCGKRIEADKKCNCYEKRRSGNRLGCDDYYSTAEWKSSRTAAMNKTFGIDIYAFYEYGKIEYASTVHHIVPLEDDYSLRSAQDNLIPLAEKNHRMIHQKYKNAESKTIYIKKLRDLLVRFAKEYGVRGVV